MGSDGLNICYDFLNFFVKIEKHISFLKVLIFISIGVGEEKLWYKSPFFSLAERKNLQKNLK